MRNCNRLLLLEAARDRALRHWADAILETVPSSLLGELETLLEEDLAGPDPARRDEIASRIDAILRLPKV